MLKNFFKKKISQQKNPFLFFNDEHFQRSNRVGRIIKKNTDILDLFEQKNGSNEFIGKSVSEKKVLIVMMFIFFGLFILFCKSFYLQMIQGIKYRELAEKNRVRVDYIKTTRGLIYDRNGKLFVKNIPKFIVSLTPSELPKNIDEKENVLNKISKLLNIQTDEIEQKLNLIKKTSLYFYKPFIIKDNINYDDAIKISILSKNLQGIHIEIDIFREYINENMKSMSHILGYTGRINELELLQDTNQDYLLTDFLGKTGIEKFYENELRGYHGSIKTEVDAFGREKKILQKNERILGNNIVLSIDSKMQTNLEQIFKEHLVKNNKNAGTAIVINPQNGEILAMVNLPTFDNNLFSKGINNIEYKKLIEDKNKPLFFRSISGEYPSGSTFKLVMSASALQEGIIKQGTTFLSAGGIKIGEWFFPDWKIGGHGVTDVKKALAESVNTFFYIIGGGFNSFEGLGVTKIHVYAKLFGLGKKLGIDLPNEKAGFLPSKEWKEREKNERWYIGDTYHLAIGQGDLLVTPLQVATFTSTIANGGIVYKPHIVKEIINPNTNQITKIEPKILESGFIDKENIKIVQDGLRQGVTLGSSKRLNSLNTKVAGKTGTAQWNSQKDTHAWFTGYAPYTNPQIVITILIEEGGEGSSTAIPVAYDFLKFWENEIK